MQVLCLDVELLVDVAVVLVVLVVFGLVGLLPALLLSRFSSELNTNRQYPENRTRAQCAGHLSLHQPLDLCLPGV